MPMSYQFTAMLLRKRWTASFTSSSLLLKRIPDKCSFNIGNRWKSLGAKSAYGVGGWVIMSHPNRCRRVTVWRAALRRALSWRMLTPLLNIHLLRFWIARLSFVNVSQYVSAFTVVPIALKSINNTPFRSQNTVVMTLPADCACLKFRALGKDECCHWRDCCSISGVKWYARDNRIQKVILWTESTGFRLWSSVSIRGTHLAYTFRYRNLSVKIL